ncbi:MAG: NAD(P)-binding domain-containing protein [Pseudomonadota bacterium]
MRDISTLIIGAGQAGLAMSHCLSQRSVEHVLLERGQVANSWSTERWDSLRLLTPNWQSRLPGFAYTGDQPDGYRNMAQTVDFLASYAQQITAPVETDTRVLSVEPMANGYMVRTDRGDWTCRSVVIATGACNIANVPSCAADLPAGVTSMTPLEYRNPAQLSDGNVLVVGASATGVQLASELRRSGRQVTLATGEHVRAPRTYRGRDIKWWMDQTGILDMTLAEVDDIKRARGVPSLQLIGSPTKETISLNALQAIGVQIAGRVMGMTETDVQFSGSLPNVCSLADLKMNRLLKQIDEWIETHASNEMIEPSYRLRNTIVPKDPLLRLNLKQAGIETVIWATGFKPDYSWLNVPVLTPRGELRHDGGVVDAPGMYVLGLPFLRRRKSSLIDGVGDDARDLATHLSAYLNGTLAAAA